MVQGKQWWYIPDPVRASLLASCSLHLRSRQPAPAPRCCGRRTAARPARTARTERTRRGRQGQRRAGGPRPLSRSRQRAGCNKYGRTAVGARWRLNDAHRIPPRALMRTAIGPNRAVIEPLSNNPGYVARPSLGAIPHHLPAGRCCIALDNPTTHPPLDNTEN